MDEATATGGRWKKARSRLPHRFPERAADVPAWLGAAYAAPPFEIADGRLRILLPVGRRASETQATVWGPVFNALSLALSRAESTRAAGPKYWRRQRDVVRRRATWTPWSGPARGSLREKARKLDKKARDGAEVPHVGTRALASFVATLEVSAPAIPRPAIAHLAWYAGLLPARWSYDAGRDSRRHLQRIVADHFLPVSDE
jgi:hypothetical protein